MVPAQAFTPPPPRDQGQLVQTRLTALEAPPPARIQRDPPKDLDALVDSQLVSRTAYPPARQGRLGYSLAGGGQIGAQSSQQGAQNRDPEQTAQFPASAAIVPNLN